MNVNFLASFGILLNYLAQSKLVNFGFDFLVRDDLLTSVNTWSTTIELSTFSAWFSPSLVAVCLSKSTLELSLTRTNLNLRLWRHLDTNSSFLFSRSGPSSAIIHSFCDVHTLQNKFPGQYLGTFSSISQYSWYVLFFSWSFHICVDRAVSCL